MSDVIGVRVPEDFVRLIDQQAAREGLGRSEWLRKSLAPLLGLAPLGAGVNGPLRADERLTPTQDAVYWLLRGHPEGMCRRDFASHDIWELSNRISEIEERVGIDIVRERCVDHPHRHRVVRYSL